MQVKTLHETKQYQYTNIAARPKFVAEAVCILYCTTHRMVIMLRCNSRFLKISAEGSLSKTCKNKKLNSTKLGSFFPKTFGQTSEFLKLFHRSF